MAMKNANLSLTKKIFRRLQKRKLVLLVALIFALLCYTPQPQQACGPFSQEAIFSFSVHPDFPMEQYAAGQLGVIQPTYARSYLAVAYRYFAGLGFDQEEQKAVTSIWQARLDLNFDDSENPAVKAWLEARKKVPGAAPISETITTRAASKDSFQHYSNCPDDAFKTAANTLNERIAKFGATSPPVKEWLQAQDQVFKNCDEGKTIPAPASAAMPPLIQADRAYQIAAANFYSQDFDEAEKRFSEIAADQTSPYRILAPYLAARALVRKGTLVAEEGKVDAATLEQAEARLKKILGDNRLSALHASARGILNYVRFRLNPTAHLHELAQAVLQKNSGATIRQDLWDYTALMDKFVKDDLEGNRKFANLPSAERSDEMTDWVMVFQVTDKAALDYTLQKWTKTPSLAWLVAALSKVDAQNARVNDLLAAAAKVKPASPAYATVAFHQVRLLMGANQTAAARTLLDTLLTQHAAALAPSTLNEFRSLRMQLAQSLDEFLQYAQRKPAAFSFNEDGREIPTTAAQMNDDATLKEFAKGRVAFDQDGREILNQNFPLNSLKEAAANKTLPAYLRREVAQAAWARAALLDDEATGNELALMLQSLAPNLKAPLDDYLNAASGNDKKFATIYFMLKYPGIEPYIDAGVGRRTPVNEIDNYRDNWWCEDFISGLDKLNATADPDNPPEKKESQLRVPDFIALSQRATAIKENAKLRALGTAPNYLCAQAVRLATLKPTDPRCAEMLHLAVKSTRYGCTNKETGKFSKMAYDLLHKNYPKSEWAAKTKFWFKGD
ncbi:MAG: hypothetical protein HY231_16770 [Acidobacteria bacterium]|nr:hypothetical protein [Acidobacteriota bacterium]